MRVRPGVLAAVLGLGVPVFGGAAQGLPSDIVDQINESIRARVRLVEGGRVMLYAPRADSMSLSYDSSEWLDNGGTGLPAHLPIGQIAGIEVYKGSHAGKGALIGGTVGAGVGLGLALLLIDICHGSTACQPQEGRGVGAVVGIIVIGAGVGGLIGSSSPRWKTVYSR